MMDTAEISAPAGPLHVAGPRVSVLIPSYKPSRQYARECLAGLEAQTFRDFEVIIIDESDEETTQFLREQPVSFPLRVIKPDRRLGLRGSLNFGIDECRGEFIARHDIDDICYPERLAEQIAFLDANPDVSAVGSWTMKIGAQSQPLGVRQFPVTPADVRKQSGFWNPMCHSALTLRRSFFETYGRYGFRNFETEDYELWFRALSRGAKMASLPKPLIQYRIEENQGFSRGRYYGEGFMLRWLYFSWDHIPIRLLGLTLAGIAVVVPPTLFKHVYTVFNRVR
jgi:glycosyltransferase involved in cell wall biosynthesis